MERSAGFSSEAVVGKGLFLSVVISTPDHPLTSVIWTHQNNILSEADERVTINNTDVFPATADPIVSTLHLTVVSLEDSGIFSVIAINAAGNTTLTFNLTVTGKSPFSH